MSDTLKVEALVRQLAPLLHGNDPWIIGAALAELTSIWLAGNVDLKSAEATFRWRQEVHTQQIALIRKLTNVNAKEMGLPYEDDGAREGADNPRSAM